MTTAGASMTDNRPSFAYYLGLDYPYIVVPGDGSYFVMFSDLPGCMTQIEDGTKMAAMAEDIRTLWIEAEYEDGHAISEPVTTTYSGRFVLRLPKRLHRDLAERAEREGMSLYAWVTSLLAERNGLARVEARLAALESRLDAATPPRLRDVA